MMECALLALGLSFFISLHYVIRSVVRSIFKLNEADVYVIACRAVSACQAIIASIIGAIIVSSCKDIMRDVHWLTNAYIYFGAPYFFYDTWAMYAYNIRCFPNSYSALDTAKRIKLFITKNKLILIHHVVLPLIILPILLLYRNNQGDYFFGIFYMIELVVPFLSAREILVQLKMKNTKLYTVTSILLIIMFFICRILVFPFLYMKYSDFANLPLWLVPFKIPFKCNLSSLIILIPQVYWFLLMLRMLKRALFNHNGQHDKNFNCTESNYSKTS